MKPLNESPRNRMHKPGSDPWVMGGGGEGWGGGCLFTASRVPPRVLHQFYIQADDLTPVLMYPPLGGPNNASLKIKFFGAVTQ